MGSPHEINIRREEKRAPDTMEIQREGNRKIIPRIVHKGKCSGSIRVKVKEENGNGQKSTNTGQGWLRASLSTDPLGKGIDHSHQ